MPWPSLLDPNRLSLGQWVHFCFPNGWVYNISTGAKLAGLATLGGSRPFWEFSLLFFSPEAMWLSYPFSATFRNHLLPVGSQGHALDIPGDLTMKHPPRFICLLELPFVLRLVMLQNVQMPSSSSDSILPPALISSDSISPDPCGLAQASSSELFVALCARDSSSQASWATNVTVTCSTNLQDFSENWRLRKSTGNPLFLRWQLRFPAGFPVIQPIQVLL